MTGNLTRELFEDTGRDEEGTMRLPLAATLPPLTKDCGEAPARQNQRHLGLTQHDVASAILKLAAPARPDNCPISTVEPCRSLPENLTQTISDSAPVLPVKRTRGRSTFLLLASTFLLLAIVLFWTFVLPSTGEGVDKVDNSQLAQVPNLPSKSAAAKRLLPMSQPANAIGSAQQAEAAPRAAASRIETSGSNAALLSDQYVAQQERAADLSEAKAIAKLVDRGMESLKSGDLESARVSLQRAVETITGTAAVPSQVEPSRSMQIAILLSRGMESLKSYLESVRVSLRRAVETIPGTAAVPSQVEPSRSMPLQGTSQARAVEQRGPQNEHSPQIKSSPDARQSARVASPKPGVAPDTGQVAPAQKNSTIRHLDRDEIAILLSRGMESLKSYLESARVSLRRAVEAIPGTAAIPSQVGPSRSMALQGTNQARTVEQPGPQNERSPQIKSSPDARQSARVARLEPGVAPGSGQVAPAQKNSTIRHLDPDEIAILLSRGMEPLKSCNLETARVSLQRAVQAIPGTAAVPSQVEPSRSMPLRGTSHALAVEQPGPQNEHSHQIKSSSDARQSARVAKLEPGVAPGSGQVAPAQNNSTVRHLDPDEIAILLSRGMDFLKSEDFASARVTLRRAAEAGNAEAALALGTTYDPSVLRQLGAIGIAADAAEAREWYEKAVKFGSAAAAQGLARLSQPTH